MTPAKKKSMLTVAKPDWERLHHDLLVLILKKVKLIQDFVAFGVVCKSWHKAFASNKGFLSRHQTPWLMLPETKGEYHQRRIFSLSKQNILNKSLYIPEMSDKRCIGLNYGWVLAISPVEKGEMSLVHPLSRAQIKLPPKTSIVEYARRAALSADPLESPSDFVLMIGGKFLGYWRPGDREWSRVEEQIHFSDVTYYQDQFYAVTYLGEVWSCKVSSHEPVVPCQIATMDWRLVCSNYPNIVGNAGTLLVIARRETEVYGSEEHGPFWEENGREYANVDYMVADFQVYELDLSKGSYKNIKNIGDRAIFIGDNTSISLDHASQLPGVKSNHIYYTDDRHETYVHTKEGGGRDMGSYNIQNGETMPFKIEESSSIINHPFWFIPSL